ncbi:lipase/esterase [Philodulcilactobacillus myokoensis]|uniref:Lipase/esterase n=1 Tax=Philodulcilactobacillus myokoensis TaxID=2929573 RepID=A0A9W6B125_9LACO|nr:alpha/beta hydrolase [Philodulcilactobacillus myokoensis]GLB46591.1 lipase/esterase [Philodulcilactobacillus myokoensis]
MQIIKQNINQNAFFRGYLRDANHETHRNKFPAIVILPGGSFTHIPPQQAESFAINFLSKGYQSFYLRYSFTDEKQPLYPAPLIELSRTIKAIKANAHKWHIDKNHIIIAGFSIGGHVAALYNDFYSQKWFQKLISADTNENDLKPTAVILGYPVINLTLGFPKNETTIKQWVDNKKEIAAEQHVNKQNAPTFIWGTADDPFVPSINSLVYAESLFQSQVQYELHIFHHGPHGLALANSITAKDDEHNNQHVASWFKLVCEWLEQF